MERLAEMTTRASLTVPNSLSALGRVIALALGLTAAVAGLIPLANGSIAMNPRHAPVGLSPAVAVARESAIASQEQNVPRLHRAPVLQPRGPIAAISPSALLPARPGDRTAGDVSVERPPRGGREFLLKMAGWRHGSAAAAAPRTPPTSSSCCPR